MNINRPIQDTARASRRRSPLAGAAALLAVAVAIAGSEAGAQERCEGTELTSGLQLPVAITQTNLGNLLVSESGTMVPNTGRISIVDLAGNRRPLLEGLPSGLSDVGEPAGPAGLFLRGRTLYVALSVGDVGVAGPVMGTTVPNPNPLSSPLFSSVLAIHFSANVERMTSGFTLSLADHATLASGQPVNLTHGRGETITIERVADFENYIPRPLPFFEGNVQLSNPFDLVAVADRLYVTDGGRNLVWQVDISTGDHSVLASFPPVPNPVTPFGPPLIDAVPTGIARSGRQLLVTLFRGFPFPPLTSVVEEIDPGTGAHAPIIEELKTAIDVFPQSEHGATEYLVLQHISGAPGPPPLAGPGMLLRITPGQTPQLVSDCLHRATSMVVDGRSGIVYVTELVTGRIVAIPLP